MGAARVLSLLVAGTASRGKDFQATACIENSLPGAWFHPLLQGLWITQQREGAGHAQSRRLLAAMSGGALT